MKHLLPSYREPTYRVPTHPRLFWISFTVAVSAAAFIFWAASAASAETGRETAGAATVWDLAEPGDLVTASQGNDATAFREEDAGFSAHHRVPDPFDGDGADDLRPRLNVTAITKALLDKPDESNANRVAPGDHVDSGGNFGIVELPMVAAVTPAGRLVSPKDVTVYYDDRGWVVAYLPADEPAAGIWRYDPQDQDRQVNDLEQNLLVLAINEVLSAARDDVDEASKIADADHESVGYYHWQYPDCNAFLLFSHESAGGTSDPIRFVVPPTIEHILASAAVLITSVPTDDQPAVSAELMVDDSAVVSVQQSDLLAVRGVELDRTDDASRLYEVTVSVDDGGTAAGTVMLVYTKPGS